MRRFNICFISCPAVSTDFMRVSVVLEATCEYNLRAFGTAWARKNSATNIACSFIGTFDSVTSLMASLFLRLPLLASFIGTCDSWSRGLRALPFRYTKSLASHRRLQLQTLIKFIITKTPHQDMHFRMAHLSLLVVTFDNRGLKLGSKYYPKFIFRSS